ADEDVANALGAEARRPLAEHDADGLGARQWIGNQLKTDIAKRDEPVALLPVMLAAGPAALHLIALLPGGELGPVEGLDSEGFAQFVEQSRIAGDLGRNGAEVDSIGAVELADHLLPERAAPIGAKTLESGVV